MSSGRRMPHANSLIFQTKGPTALGNPDWACRFRIPPLIPKLAFTGVRGDILPTTWGPYTRFTTALARMQLFSQYQIFHMSILLLFSSTLLPSKHGASVATNYTNTNSMPRPASPPHTFPSQKTVTSRLRGLNYHFRQHLVNATAPAIWRHSA